MWKLVDGYKWLYRVSDQGEVQRQCPNGKWRTIKPYMNNNQARVGLIRPDGTKHRASVSGLVADGFMGGTPQGMLRCHKNGMKWDNAVENIVFLPPSKAATRHRPGNSRTVLKLDRQGNVVAMYRSSVEAAKANHISQAAISKRCLGLIEDPYRLDGYDYRYEGMKRGRKKKEIT